MRTRALLTSLLVLIASAVATAIAPGPPQTPAAAVSGNTVTLTWLAPATGGVPTGYVVEASLSPGGPLIASLPVNGTTLVVPGVSSGVYYVAIRGVNADGAGSRSNEIMVVVPSGSGSGCTLPPNAPTNLASTVTGNTVMLAWNAPVGGCAPTGYVVQAGSAAGLSNIALINAGTATTLTASAPAGTYFVRVIATNSAGGSSASNEIVVNVTATPNLTGLWAGTSDYFNAPFAFDLTQSGNDITGRYSDQHDQGFVTGSINGTTVVLDVRFGDTGIRFEGTLETADRIRGTIRGSAIGSGYTFTMMR